jgi:hypothetical protein
MVAEALADWLPRIIQATKPFFSPDIEKGAQWSTEVDTALEGTKFGIICLTRDNLDSRWIHYEAGALSKTADARIWTFLLNIRPSDVGQPLGKFQATFAHKEDVRQLVRAINGRLIDVGNEPLPERLLDESFEAFWQKLDEQLEIARNADLPQESVRRDDVPDTRAILDEVLTLLRSHERRFEEMQSQIGSQTPARALRRGFVRGVTVRVFGPASYRDIMKEVLLSMSSVDSIVESQGAEDVWNLEVSFRHVVSPEGVVAALRNETEHLLTPESFLVIA